MLPEWARVRSIANLFLSRQAAEVEPKLTRLARPNHARYLLVKRNCIFLQTNLPRVASPGNVCLIV